MTANTAGPSVIPLKPGKGCHIIHVQSCLGASLPLPRFVFLDELLVQSMTIKEVCKAEDFFLL
jgi:hypothetical protein